MLLLKLTPLVVWVGDNVVPIGSQVTTRWQRNAGTVNSTAPRYLRYVIGGSAIAK